MTASHAHTEATAYLVRTPPHARWVTIAQNLLNFRHNTHAQAASISISMEGRFLGNAELADLVTIVLRGHQLLSHAQPGPTITQQIPHLNARYARQGSIVLLEQISRLCVALEHIQQLEQQHALTAK